MPFKVDVTPLAARIDALSALTARVSGWICVVATYVMFSLLLVQVVLRYFFGSPPSWAGEVSISLFAWVVLLYATVGVRKRFHVVVDLIPFSDTSFATRVMDRLVMVLVIAFGVLLIYAGTGYVERTQGQRSAALQFPIEYVYLAAPVCGVLFILHAVALLFHPKTSAQRP